MFFIDTHAHLYLDAFEKDIDAVIKQSVESGVPFILLPNIDDESVLPLHRLHQQYPRNCFSMMGLHPTSVGADYLEVMERILSHLKTRSYSAIGECGMDLYWDKTYTREQEIVFRKHLDWASEFDLPIVIHCRNAYDEILKVLLSYHNPLPKGVFHCFPGDVNQARKVIDLGFYLGIGGVVTYKNSMMQRIVKELGLSRVVLETDAPFLTPVPYRGSRNESKNIVSIARYIADITDIPLMEIAEITTKNAITLFKLPTNET